MKLFEIAEEALDELQGISFDARVWFPIIRNAIKISKNTPNPVIDGKTHPSEYKVFPIDYIHFDVKPEYGTGAGYDENKSGYENDEYHVYLAFGTGATDSAINHELKHAFEDFKKISKGRPSAKYSKEGINLFSGDFEKFMLSHSSREYFAPISTIMEGLYYTSKLERSAFSDTVYDEPIYADVIKTIIILMEYCNESYIFYKYKPEVLEEKWVKYKENFHIPVTDKFGNYKDFIKWGCDEVNYKGNITLKKLRKIQYMGQQHKKEGGN